MLAEAGVVVDLEPAPPLFSFPHNTGGEVEGISNAYTINLLPLYLETAQS